jgi:hypothetical protein
MEAKKLAWVYLLLVVMPPSGAWAAAAESEATAAPALPVARSALLPRTENVAAKMMPTKGSVRGLDNYQWLDTGKQQGLLVHRAAYQAPGKGVALLVSADAGALNGGSLIGQLRQVLPATDWHSYLVGLPLLGVQPAEQQDLVVVQRVTQAFELLKAAHPESPLVVFGEGSAGDPLATLFTPDGALEASGLVLLNQPPPKAIDGTLTKLQTPTLLLQMLPNRYPVGYPLAPAVELRQLPRVSTRQPKSLVVRQVRGWLRQFEQPRSPQD